MEADEEMLRVKISELIKGSRHNIAKYKWRVIRPMKNFMRGTKWEPPLKGKQKPIVINRIQ